MAKQTKSAEGHLDEKKQNKRNVERVAEPVGGQVQLTDIVSSMMAAGDGSIEAQASQLSDFRLQPVQRQALAAQIGRVQGNRHLQRVLTSNQNKTIQRYAVGVPADAGCAEVVDWLNTSNPHVPNWAKTRVRFNWGGSFLITGSAPDFHLRVGNPQVTMIGPSVDMPQWSPSDPAMQTAWQAMVQTLRTHEGEHEKIAKDWKAT
jgi:hypothetical protein